MLITHILLVGLCFCSFLCDTLVVLSFLLAYFYFALCQLFCACHFALTCGRNLVAYVTYMDLSLGFVYT